VGQPRLLRLRTRLTATIPCEQGKKQDLFHSLGRIIEFCPNSVISLEDHGINREIFPLGQPEGFTLAQGPTPTGINFLTRLPTLRLTFGDTVAPQS
jgi:hypothetical protein